MEFTCMEASGGLAGGGTDESVVRPTACPVPLSSDLRVPTTVRVFWCRFATALSPPTSYIVRRLVEGLNKQTKAEERAICARHDLPLLK